MRLSPDALVSLIVYLIIATVLLGAVALTTATAIIPLRLALSQADAIKQGEQAQATVQYRKYSTPSTGQVKKSGLKLMGATQKVVFFYDANEERTIVIPQAQLVSIEVPE